MVIDSRSLEWVPSRGIALGAAVGVAVAVVGLLLAGCGRPAQESAEAMRLRIAAERYERARQLRRTHPERALALLAQALDGDPSLGRAHNDRGVLLLGQHRLGAARDAFLRAVELRPADPIPRHNLAIALVRLHQPQAALAACEAALACDEHHVPALQMSAWIRIRHELPGSTPIGDLLREVLMGSPPDGWRKWARRYQFKVEPRRPAPSGIPVPAGASQGRSLDRRPRAGLPELEP